MICIAHPIFFGGDKIEKDWSGKQRVQVRGVYRVLVGKPEGKRPLGRPRRR